MSPKTARATVAQVETTGAAPETDDRDESLFLRGLVHMERDQAVRWASYGLPKVPPIAQFEDFAAASRKRHDLATEASSLGRQLDATTTEITRGFIANRTAETERQARNILEGRPEEAFAGFEELRAKVARLNQRMEAYGEAVRMQDEVVAGIRSERSIDAAEIMQAAHMAAVSDMIAAVEQLRTALDREGAARAAVADAGYDARLPTFAMPHILHDNAPLDDLVHRGRDYTR